MADERVFSISPNVRGRRDGSSSEMEEGVGAEEAVDCVTLAVFLFSMACFT